MLYILAPFVFFGEKAKQPLRFLNAICIYYTVIYTLIWTLLWSTPQKAGKCRGKTEKLRRCKLACVCCKHKWFRKSGIESTLGRVASCQDRWDDVPLLICGPGPEMAGGLKVWGLECGTPFLAVSGVVCCTIPTGYEEIGTMKTVN